MSFIEIYSLVSPPVYILLGYYLGERGLSGVISDMGSLKTDVANLKVAVSNVKLP